MQFLYMQSFRSKHLITHSGSYSAHCLPLTCSTNTIDSNIHKLSVENRWKSLLSVYPLKNFVIPSLHFFLRDSFAAGSSMRIVCEARWQLFCTMRLHCLELSLTSGSHMIDGVEIKETEPNCIRRYIF